MSTLQAMTSLPFSDWSPWRLDLENSTCPLLLYSSSTRYMRWFDKVGVTGFASLAVKTKETRSQSYTYSTEIRLVF